MKKAMFIIGVVVISISFVHCHNQEELVSELEKPAEELVSELEKPIVHEQSNGLPYPFDAKSIRTGISVNNASIIISDNGKFIYPIYATYHIHKNGLGIFEYTQSNHIAPKHSMFKANFKDKSEWLIFNKEDITIYAHKFRLNNFSEFRDLLNTVAKDNYLSGLIISRFSEENKNQLLKQMYSMKRDISQNNGLYINRFSKVVFNIIDLYHDQLENSDELDKWAQNLELYGNTFAKDKEGAFYVIRQDTPNIPHVPSYFEEDYLMSLGKDQFLKLQEKYVYYYDKFPLE